MCKKLMYCHIFLLLSWKQAYTLSQMSLSDNKMLKKTQKTNTILVDNVLIQYIG